MKLNKKKIFKYTGLFIVGLIILLILATLSLRLAPVQNFVKDKVVNYVQDKIKTPISLDRVYINFPNHLELENLYVEGQDKDTILMVNQLNVGLNIPQLLDNKAQFTSIDVDGLVAYVKRNEKGTFNFDYIIEAFATDEEESSESKPFIIDLDKINLKNIKVNYDDRITKNNLNVIFKAFKTQINEFDLEKNAYDIGDIYMDGLRLKLKQDILVEASKNIEEKADSLSAQNPLKLALNDIELVNFDVDYQDDNSKTYAKIKFQELITEIKKLNIQANEYEIGDISLSEADIITNLYLPTEKEIKNDTVEVSNNENSSIKLLLTELELDQVNVEYNNTAIAKTSNGIDFNHLDIDDLNFKMSDFEMVNSTFQGDIHNGSFIEQSGLVLKQLETDFSYTNTNLNLKDLLLKTQNTTLQDEVLLSYSSIDELTKNPGHARLNLKLDNSKIGFKDIRILAPEVSKEKIFQKYPNATIYLDTKIDGLIDDLQIEKLTVSGLDDFNLIANGQIKNATSPDHLFFDLDIKRLSAKAKTIYNVTPAGTIPNNISIPRSFVAKGKLKGTPNNLYTNLNINSTDGAASIVGTLDLRKTNQEKYDLELLTNNLNIGNIIKNPAIGEISANIAAKGNGFDFKTADAKIFGDISKAVYNGYTYNNIHLKGGISNSIYNIDLNSKDQNAQLNLIASGSYTQENPTIRIAGDITKLDVHQLNFYNEPLILAGSINGEFQNLNPDELNGRLALKDFAISDTKDVYPLSEINLIAKNNEESNSIILHSQFADLSLVGKYKLTEIFKALENSINQYYTISENSKGLENIQPNQYFDLNAQIKNDKLLRKFVPELKSFNTINVTGHFDAQQNNLELAADIPHVEYGENNLSNATFNLNNQDNQLNYKLNIEELKAGDYGIKHLGLKGQVSDNTIYYTLSTKNTKGEVNYLIDGQAKQTKQFIQLALNPDGLILNKKQWQVSNNNQIQIFDKGLNIDNFKISNANSFISLQSENTTPSSALNLNIQNFEIENITNFLEQDTLIAKGELNANINMQDIYTQPLFEGNININKLFFYNAPVGDLAINLTESTSNKLNANAKLTGFDNNLSVDGYYDISNSSMNLTADIRKLNMESLQGFTFNEIQKGEGYLDGKLKITGSTSAPNIDGNLKFNDVGMFITQLGTSFEDINDNIVFNSTGINFNRFTIADEDANTMVLDGTIKTSTYQDFIFDLRLTSEDFKAINAEKNEENIVYGILSLGADLKITGNLNLPVVSGTLSIDEPTNFTFVLPSSSPSLQEREGVVEFIDQDQIVLNETIKNDTIDTTSRIQGMDVNVNISVKKDAKVSIVIDQATGDFVEIQGSAELNGGIDPSGKTTLSGIYEVSKGSYQLNVNMLQRKFDIQKGSTITWNGDPLSADINITAIYRLETSPIDLLEQQLAGRSGAQLNIYKQRIPFNTILKMNGELMKPEISFDITLDESNPGVASEVIDNTKTKLSAIRNETSEMNKQVFALLLLNRFIGENPFQSDAGMSAETMAKQSVSRILSEQLNNLAGDLIEGVDLNFDLDSREDYTSGRREDRTDLNVSLSKTLLNDRLKVTVGNKFGVEGEARTNESMTNIAGDISLDYSLSRDGRYILRAYRKNDYQVALQGQVIETGIGFIITIEYDKFRELFLRSEKKRKNKKRDSEE